MVYCLGVIDGHSFTFIGAQKQRKKMRKKIEWKREHLEDNTWRVMVIGGWIVYCLEKGKNNISLASTYVPDRDHEWSVAAQAVEAQWPKKDIGKDFKPAPNCT